MRQLVWAVAVLLAVAEASARAGEEEAVQAIERWGRAERDEAAPGRPVTRVTVMSGKDEDLKVLKDCSQLRELDLSSTLITDAGLKELTGLCRLTSLRVRSPLVTDAGLKELAALRQLQELDLFHMQVTDAGLKEIREFKPRTRAAGPLPGSARPAPARRPGRTSWASRVW